MAIKTPIWQYWYADDWHVGTNINDHRKNTEEAGYLTRDLFANEEHEPLSIPYELSRSWAIINNGHIKFDDDGKIEIYESKDQARLNVDKSDEVVLVPSLMSAAFSARQASHQEIGGEPVAIVRQNSSGQIYIAKPNGDPFPFNDHVGSDLYTHPNSADAPNAEYIRALQDAFDIIDQNYGSLCRIGSVLANLKAVQEKGNDQLKEQQVAS
jgi:hypothetical protein